MSEAEKYAAEQVKKQALPLSQDNYRDMLAMAYIDGALSVLKKTQRMQHERQKNDV